MHASTATRPHVDAPALIEAGFDHAHRGLAVLSLDGRFLRVNAAYLRLTGWDEAALLGAGVALVLHPDERGAVARRLERLAAGADEREGVPRRYLRPDGSVVWVRASCTALTGSDGDRVAVLVEADDLTERRREEGVLRDRAARQAAIASLGQRALSGLALDVLLPEVTATVSEVLGILRCSLLEARPGGLFLRAGSGWPDGVVGERVLPEAPDASPAAYALAIGDPVVSEDLLRDDRFSRSPFLRQQGIRASACVVLPGRAGPIGVLAIHLLQPRRFSADDLDFLQSAANVAASAFERQRSDAAARHQATHDPLTGLANRTVLADRLETVLRSGDGAAALLLLDLDRFKEINDTLGHRVGDLVLIEVARRLERTLRSDEAVVRLGGDEFAVVLAGGALQAVALACRLVEALQRPLDPAAQEAGDGLLGAPLLSVGASVGIAVAPDHGRDAAGLLQRADVAMYRAKEQATGWAVYTEGSDDLGTDRLVLVGALRQALDDGQLELHYQPLVDLVSGRVCALEALARWQSPTLGSVPPDTFIPVAERTGLIRPLTAWALRRALQDGVGLAAASGGARIPIAVNLSASSLLDPGLVPTVLSALADAGAAPSSLQLEITESALLRDADRAVTVLRSLSDLGVRLAVDDFGTGYSSMRYLKQLPVQELKIDRTFVTGLLDDDTDRAIVRAVVQMAHSLGFDVVAEGVETAAVGAALVDLGCDFAQGFHYARPEPVAAARASLEQGRGRRQG